MKQLVFNPTNTATLLFPGLDAELVKGLFLKCHNTLMLRLVRTIRDISKYAPKIVAETRLREAFESLCSCTSQTQARVISYPSFAFWLDVTDGLLRRDAHFRFPEMHFAHHLQEFWRFAAAGVLLDKREQFACRMTTNGSGLVTLPGTATFLSGEGLGAYELVSCVINHGEFSLVKKVGSDEEIRHQVHYVPLVANGLIELNAIDDDFHLAGRTTYDYESIQPQDIPRWDSALADAWSLLGDSRSDLVKELSLGIRALVPVVGGAVDTHSSASFSEAPGLIALSWHPDPVVLAEALVHEYHHQKLNSLQVIDPLVLGPSGQLFYSPWRPDPRPLNGILHGAYVFQAVLRWWDQLDPTSVPSLTSDRIAARKYVLCGQLRSAVDTLVSKAELTPLGGWLCAAMDRTVQEFASCVGATVIGRESMEKTLEQHRVAWHKANDHALQTCKPIKAGGTLEEEAETDNNLLPLLGFPESRLNGAVSAREDILLERIAKLSTEEAIQQLRAALGTYSPGESVLRLTIRGHVAYTIREYNDAARYYSAALANAPASASLWQLFAFSFRHLGRWGDSALVLGNIGKLTTNCLRPGFTDQTNPEDVLAMTVSAIRNHQQTVSR